MSPSSEPVTIDRVVTDPAWIARSDQTIAAVHRRRDPVLWTYGESARLGQRPEWTGR